MSLLEGDAGKYQCDVGVRLMVGMAKEERLYARLDIFQVAIAE